jgi:type II secretory pathway pseudopilin PulG
MINKKYKRAFSMITAIFVIIMMATLASLIQNITGKTIKATTQQYQKEQATLLARSYTELAILYATGYDRSPNNCLNNIKGNFGSPENRYKIEIKIRYIDENSTAIQTCTKNNQTSISLLIDTYIHYKDFDEPTNRTKTFHRRTLQKI